MKKIIVFLFVISIVILIPKKEDILLSDGIRYRIIANSDSGVDQETKWNINKEVIPILSTINFDDSTDVSNKLPTKIKEIEQIIDKYNVTYSINYGLNYFPQKTYNNKVYKEGNYKSLVITLGSGDGHNWWCFLFPPLCNLELNKENIDDYTYDLYFKKVINKYF